MNTPSDHVVVLRELRACFASWEPHVRVLGNVRADGAIAALDYAIAAVEGWRPIESAPIKGTFLVFGGKWTGESTDGGQQKDSAITLVNRNGRSKFYVADADEFWPWIEKPTHWMPLPAPPQANEQGEG